MSIQVDQTYVDFGLSFTAHPVTGDLVLVRGAEAIKQSVKIIILHNFHERPFAPFFGGNVSYHLFETDINDITASKLKADVTRAITNFEPRAILISVTITPDADRNGFDCTIVFRPINLTDPVTVSVFLKRVR